MKFVDEATQALSKILNIPTSHARSIAESLDDETRQATHQVAELAANNLRVLVALHQQRAAVAQSASADDGAKPTPTEIYVRKQFELSNDGELIDAQHEYVAAGEPLAEAAEVPSAT